MKVSLRNMSAAIRNHLCIGGLALMVVLVVMSTFSGSLQARMPAGQQREMHAIWAHPGDAGKTVESVRQFVTRCKQTHIDTIVMLVKGMHGETYWKSRRFPQTVASGYQSFDLLEHLTREARAQGIKVDAWLCDFVEGVNGAAYREHPEWAQLNPSGGTTATETLGLARRPYPYVWMCPARRPGYTDSWLLPMIEEIASNYQVDSIHHDYVRYPGDVAPDSYCFCDYCLKHIPRFAMLGYETGKGERFRVNAVQERIEANWWSDPTMIPADWGQRDRREMADYLLNGRTIPDGPPDVRYFFYDYRVHQIDAFARAAWERVQQINKSKGTNIGVSAAVFKNPIQSARFIGQHWDEWSPWLSIFMPMTYRSHFAGNFDSYLEHLTETTSRQMEWIGREKPLLAGIATTYLFREEWKPIDDMRERLQELLVLASDDLRGRETKVQALKTSYSEVRSHFAKVSPDREREVSRRIDSLSASADRASHDELVPLLNQLRNDPPVGFLPADKLTRAIEAARKAQPNGIIIFAAGSLTREKLWPTLEAAFRK